MARPQIEDGHTKIANEILEHLIKMHLSPNQWQVLLCVIRKTYGFQKKVDHIANSQIVETTGLCKAVVSRTLTNLEDMKMIFRNGKNMGFLKDWEQWQKLAVSSTKVSNSVNKKKLAVSSTLDTKLAEQSTNEKLAILSPQLTKSSTKVDQTAIPPSPLPPHPFLPLPPQQKKKETIQKKGYGEFNNVLLSDEEYQKLTDRFSKNWADNYIEQLSGHIQQKKGNEKKYTDHYATLRNWLLRDGRSNGTHQGNTKKPKEYTDPDELRREARSRAG